jgi:uncharacterized protein involved in exopolysaccharide biosynthesis
MLPEVNQQTYSDFDRAIAFLLRHMGLIVMLAGFGGGAGVALSYCISRQFRADAVLIPSDEMLGLNQNGILGNLGGLASLVAGGAAGNRQNEAIATLRSRELTMSYIQKNGLLPILFHDRWDSAANKWKVGSLHSIPSLEDGFTVFDKRIRMVSENHKTGLITFSITWTDPTLAKIWTDGLVSATNDHLRMQAIERSGRNIEYLQKASDATSVMEVRATIYKLMEAEIKKQMAATGNKDYAFRVVDPAIVPEHKVSPVRSLFLILGAILGPTIWWVVYFVRNVKAKVTR